MRKIITLLAILLLFSCKTAEERICEHSYTDYWYYSDSGERYQVYQTSMGNKYILVINKKQTKIIRKYIK
jgi:hypothetical protein